MELLIKAKDISVEYTGRDILNIDELELYSYDRIGLVGGNGAGKSTLLKVLLGEINPAGSKVNRFGSFAYIPQLEEAVSKEVEAYSLLGKLGVKELQLKAMSGGEETRLKIAQALSKQVHGIFADEPTSHLDREGIDFLIGQLKFYSGALLVISHDRYFLDETVNKIWELKDGTIKEYWGNYSDYLHQREEEERNQALRYQQFMDERDRLQKAAEEKRRQAQKLDQKSKGAARSNEGGGRLSHQKSMGSKQKKLHNAARSMDHRLASMEEIVAPEGHKSICFKQSKSLSLHNPFPIMGEALSKSFDDRLLLDSAAFSIPLGAKVAITGGNGVGKTTLLKMILNREEGITISPKAEIGYFSQTGYKYNADQNIMAFMQEESDYNVSDIRSVLASLGFKSHDIPKQLSVLSGGEMIKLMLAKLLLGKYNILLMDEPSNFLDIPAVEALEAMMKGYGGTIVFVSHDKQLVEHVADHIYEIKDYKLNLISK